MTKTYIRPCPVRLIGEDLRKAKLENLVPIYPCAFSTDFDTSVWLVLCSCGVEFKADSSKLLSREVVSCGQCDGAEIQSEVTYIAMPDCSNDGPYLQ